MQGNKIKYALAKAIIKKLWVEGLITRDEMARIDERNKKTFEIDVGDAA